MELVDYKGGGFVTVTQPSNEKQLSTEAVQKLVYDVMKESFTLLTVNNSTDSRKINPRMREHSPDHRVYTLVLTSKIRKK